MSDYIIPENFIGNAKQLDSLDNIASLYSIEVALLKAVVEIESSGEGFLPSNKPVILFESHIFHSFTNGKYVGITDSNGKPISTRYWDRNTYGAAGDWQYHRLSIAYGLDKNAALKSCSWGMFQVMGFNYNLCGNDSIEEMIYKMCESEDEQVKLAMNFMERNNCLTKLRQKDFAGFAELYNGSGYRENQYDVKLERAYNKHLSNIHITPIKKSKTLVLGDSLAYGVAGFIKDCINLAVVGSGYNHWKNNINSINFEGYNNVFISMGLNDFPNNEEVYTNNIKFILDNIISRDRTNSVKNIFYLKPTTRNIRRDLIDPSKLISKILIKLQDYYKKLIIIEIDYPVLNKMIGADKLHYTSEGYRNIAFLLASNINNDYPLIKMGYTGIDVKFLQSALYEIDKSKYNVGKKDGIFGNKTIEVIRNYQKDNNLSIDGIVGSGTWGSIIFNYNKIYEQ